MAVIGVRNACEAFGTVPGTWEAGSKWGAVSVVPGKASFPTRATLPGVDFISYASIRMIPFTLALFPLMC